MTISVDEFAYVSDLLRTSTGISLEDDKSYLVDSRLMPLAREHGMADVSELVNFVRHHDDGSLLVDVLDSLCTNETSWLRDGEPFRVIVDKVLPQLMDLRAQTRTLTFWSAACSTGQEPYSLAMMLEDVLPARGWAYQVVATDVSRSSLARAESGLYRQPEISRGLPASLLVRHFTRDGSNWRISQQLRDRVRFERSNLVNDPPPVSRADVVLLRNVLIYFDLDTRRAVLDKVRSVLTPGGVLLLGAAETTLGLSEGWIRTVYGRTTFNEVDRQLVHR